MTIRSLVLGCLFTVFVTGADVLAATRKSETLVREAWQAWEQNNQALVERKFQEALAADSTNTRAHLGLSMLYDLQEKYDRAWMSFRPVLRTAENVYPYLFAEWITPKMYNQYDLPGSGILDLLESLRRDPKADGLMRAGANQALGNYYNRKGQLEKARAYYRDMRMVTRWTLVGPFDNLSASGFDKVFPPETAYDPAAVYEGKNSIPARWFSIDEQDNYFWINFRYHFSQSDAVFYANTFVYSPARQPVQLRIGTSGALKAFLNDQLMIAYFDENNNDIGTYIVATELQPGWNRLLVKCGYSEITRCNFSLQITDKTGTPVEGLQFSTDPQAYPRQPGAPGAVIENFAEAYFKRQMEKSPDHWENYLLLADTYLRNDKAVEAELVLRQAIRRLPGCALFHHHILEAYSRGEKYDEIATTIEKLSALDSRIPAVLEYRIDQHLENEDFDRAEPLIKQAEALLPASAWVYQTYLNFYGKKKQLDRIIDLSRAAYERYPANQTFATTEALLSIQTTRQFGRAIDIFKRYVQDNYDETGLSILASLHLQASDIENWQATYQRIFAVEPANPAHYNQMASTYISMQDYASAETLLRKALKLCPGHADYWARLGDVYRATNRLNEARDAYHTALTYRPTHYKIRRVLRELEGKPSIFSHFSQIDPYRLIAAGPAASAYPGSNAVILLQDHKRVVYEGGASEYASDLLIRVLNKNGIDDFHDYWIDYNPNTEELTLEKAVTIKQDGSEITADADEGHLVFKSLQEGDYIYIKYRVANYYDGKLSTHFWDTFYFSLFYPQKSVRYALLVPEKLTFHHRTQAMPDEPAVTRTPDGMLYEWKVENEPAVAHEAGMPILNDVGKMLYISSIGDWSYMTAWYQDLAQTKARSSYEIREQVAQLFEGKKGASTDEKIDAIYRFITENIRYSSVPFRQSALIPQKARDVLVNRIGDCKDVTTLGIAMLREAGINAYYVLVNTNDEGYNRRVLPSIAFNHCIAAVETDKGLTYLDFTANSHPVGSLPVMDLDGFSLLIKPEVNTPGYLAREHFMANNILREERVDLRGDNSALLRVATVRTGYMSASVRSRYQNAGEEERKKLMTEALSADYPNVKLLRFDLKNLDDLTPMVYYEYDCEVPGFVTDAAQFKLFMVPWADRLESYEGVSYPERRYPIFQWTVVDTVTETLSITLPQGYVPMESIPDVRLSSSIADYTVQYAFADGVLTARRQLIAKKMDVMPEAYAEFKQFYNAVVREDSRQILLKMTD